MELYENRSELIIQCTKFRKFAHSNYHKIKEHSTNVSNNKIITTYSRDLGIASPSQITKHIKTGYSIGEVIAFAKPGQIHRVFYYDSDGFPTAIDNNDYITDMNVLAKTSSTRYFIKYEDAIWTAWFSSKGKILFNENYKLVFDENKRLKGLYEIDAGESPSITSEEYDYSKIKSGIVTCYLTSYKRCSDLSTNEISVDYSEFIFCQQKIVIDVDETGKYTALSIYENQSDSNRFIKRIDLK